MLELRITQKKQDGSNNLMRNINIYEQKIDFVVYKHIYIREICAYDAYRYVT